MKTRARTDKEETIKHVNGTTNGIISVISLSPPPQSNGNGNNSSRANGIGVGRPRPPSSGVTSPEKRLRKITKSQEERMDLIAKALRTYTDDLEKLLSAQMWKSLIRMALRGTNEERKCRDEGYLNQLANGIIEQITTKPYAEKVGELLQLASTNGTNTRRVKNSMMGEDRGLKFLLLAAEYDRSQGDRVIRKALGEGSSEDESLGHTQTSDSESDNESDHENGCVRVEISEGEKENASAQSRRLTRNSVKAHHQSAPLRIKSSQTVENSRTAMNGTAVHQSSSNPPTPLSRDEFYSRNSNAVVDVLLGRTTSRRSPILNGHDDEIIENDTPPPTPNGCDPDAVIPRKRYRLSSNASDRLAPIFSRNGRSKSSDISFPKPFGYDRLDDSPRSSRHSGDGGNTERCDIDLMDEASSKDSCHEELPDLEPPDTGRDKESLPKSEQEIQRDYPKPLTGPELKPFMFEEIEEALSRPRKDKIVSAFGLTLMQEQLAVYNKSEWLEDVNIDFYLEMIRHRNNRTGSSYPKVYIFQSYFYKLLDKRGYDSVQGATERDNIFEYDLLLIPIHSDHHWVLVVVDFPRKSMVCYDSMDHNNEKHLRTIAYYLKREWKAVRLSVLNGKVGHGRHNLRHSTFARLDRFEANFMDASDELELTLGETWTIRTFGAEDIPQQKNGRDCGVFCLQFAEYLSRKQEFDFEQRHTAYFRKRMLYETLKKTLLIS